MSSEQRVEKCIQELIRTLGDDPLRPELERTPRRYVESLRFMTRGLREDIDSEIAEGLMETPSNDMVAVRNIEFVSICEHHLLPFFGKVHVAYLPDGRLIGLSKVARVVDHYACRLQVQERMTRQIADHLQIILKPKWVGVIAIAVHMCMVARGVRKQDSDVVTTAWRGDLGTTSPEEYLINLAR